MREALLYDKLEREAVRCRLCAHGCTIQEGKSGICRVRENKDGGLFSLTYGKPIAANPDPIEKKPLFHFLPGSVSFSIATMGCNFQCGFCQNWDISQYGRERTGPVPGGGPGGKEVPPGEIARAAAESRAASISYTYTEPTIYFEYARDIMELAHPLGLKNVFVSNGFESADCAEACRGLLDSANIDLKAMRDSFYREECKAKLQPVLDTLKRFHAMGVWLEVTTLLIPGKNDDRAELKDLAGFIATELAPWVPWHVSAYSPRYKYSADGPGPTPASSLETALAIGREAGLHYVYAGNLPGHQSESTFCPDCGERVVHRAGYTIRHSSLDQSACPACGRRIEGVWQ